MSRGPTYTNFVASGSVTMLCIQATRGGSTKFQQLVVESWRQLLSRPSLCQHAHPGPLECRHSTALAAVGVPTSAVGPGHICHQQQHVIYLQQKQMLSEEHASPGHVQTLHSIQRDVLFHHTGCCQGAVILIGCVADAEML